jgi:hypothetical protein
MDKKEKRVVRNFRLSLIEDFDRKLQETHNDMLWNTMPMNNFIRHCVEVGLNEIRFEMDLRRDRYEAGLAAAAGEYAVQRPEAGVQAQIIQFPESA